LICATIAGEHSTSTTSTFLASTRPSQLTQSRTPHELMRSTSPRSITTVLPWILSVSSVSSLSSSMTPASFTKLRSSRWCTDAWNF
jgi:hypothetical protein